MVVLGKNILMLSPNFILAMKMAKEAYVKVITLTGMWRRYLFIFKYTIHILVGLDSNIWNDEHMKLDGSFLCTFVMCDMAAVLMNLHAKFDVEACIYLA